MAKIVLTISANNKATQSVKLLNAEVQTLSKTLSSIKVDKSLNTTIQKLTENYKVLSKIANKTLKAETQNVAVKKKQTFEVNATTVATKKQTQAQDKATQSTQKATTAIKQNTEVNKEHRQSILSMTRGILEWQIATTLVMKPLRMLQDALASINETLVKTEDSVIALQRVLPSGSATDSEISGKLYQIAQDYGQTFENVSQIAQNFARTGMSWADTIKATEAAVLALNVAELDATEASEGLISIITQFDMSTAQLTETVDKLNKAADQNPVTTEKLLKALQRTGAAAKNANITLDQTIGIITTLSKATNRSGENLGTAINSLIQFSSKSSSLDTFAKLGGSVETAVEKYRAGAGSILEIWEKLSEVIKNRQGDAESILGGDLFGDEEWAGLNAELKAELGESYADITDIYDTASTFRKNYFIALLNDMENVKKVSGEIANAAGYSQDENQKYLDTYTAKLNTLKAQWQDIANDEQGLLGIKKDLIDLGSGVLNIIKGLGGLKAVLGTLSLIIGTIVIQTKGAQIIAKLQTISKTIKSLTIDAIPNLIKTYKDWRRETVLLGQSTATFGQVLKASLPLITLVTMLISALDSAIQQESENRKEAERKKIEAQNEAIAKTNESIEAQKKEVTQMNEVASTVENLRKILDDSSQSEEEKAKAQDKLLQIQNTLIDSNNSYKDSLDLTNGSIKEQLGLIEQLTTEQLKQKAQDFLSEKDSEIKIANSRLESTSTTNTDYFLNGTASDRHRFRDILDKAIEGANVNGVSHIDDNQYGFIYSWANDIAKSEGFWDGLGNLLNPFDDIFSKEGWTGGAHEGLSFSGTVEQQIDTITKLQEYITKHRDELGLSAEEHTAINSELDKQLIALNSEEYKQAQLLAERAKLADDYLNKRITEEEFLEKFYGIQKDISKEIGNQTNDISKVTGKYDDLISKLKELRDYEDESVDLAEKKKNLLDEQNELLKAQQALENAKNEATVRRFNQATGQWEWQTDEKKIAEAEEAVKKQEETVDKAREELEKQAYDTIIDQLEKETATNESILAILKEVAPLLGEDFSDAVQNAIKDKTGVDITKPAVSNFDAAQNYINENGLKESDREKWTEDKTFEKLFNALTDEEKAKLKGTTLNIAESGLSLTSLIKKIFEPVSSADFEKTTKGLGIIFESAIKSVTRPIIEHFGGNTDNSVDNSGQINFGGGLTVGGEYRNPLLEILRNANIIPND